MYSRNRNKTIIYFQPKPTPTYKRIWKVHWTLSIDNTPCWKFHYQHDRKCETLNHKLVTLVYAQKPKQKTWYITRQSQYSCHNKPTTLTRHQWMQVTRQCLIGDAENRRIRPGTQRRMTKNESGLGSPKMSWPTKFELNLIGVLFANARKVLEQSESRERRDFSGVWLKVN